MTDSLELLPVVSMGLMSLDTYRPMSALGRKLPIRPKTVVCTCIGCHDAK
jgi:hypothetical protein